MSNSDANAHRSLQCRPQQKPHEQRESAAINSHPMELKTLYTKLEASIQGVTCEVVEAKYNSATPDLNIDDTPTEIMAGLPENLYELVAILNRLLNPVLLSGFSCFGSHLLSARSD